jgi:hypothetical protein
LVEQDQPQVEVTAIEARGDAHRLLLRLAPGLHGRRGFSGDAGVPLQPPARRERVGIVGILRQHLVVEHEGLLGLVTLDQQGRRGQLILNLLRLGQRDGA